MVWERQLITYAKRDFDSLYCAFKKHSFHLNKDLRITVQTQTLLDYYSVIRLKLYNLINIYHELFSKYSETKQDKCATRAGIEKTLACLLQR